MHSLKTLRKLIGIIGLIGMVFGFVMAIINAGKDIFSLYLAVGFVGLGLFLLSVLILIYEKKNGNW